MGSWISLLLSVPITFINKGLWSIAHSQARDDRSEPGGTICTVVAKDSLGARRIRILGATPKEAAGQESK